LKKKISGIEIEMIKSSGGAFEIARDGDLIYSKLRQGRFPENKEIIDLLKE